MAKLKKGDCVIVTLPSGKRTDGHYMGLGHKDTCLVSVSQLEGVDSDGRPSYEKHTYTVPLTSVRQMKSESDNAFSNQLYEWYDRADILQTRITDAEEELQEFSAKYDEDDEMAFELKWRLLRKIEWFSNKLKCIEKKITDEEER